MALWRLPDWAKADGLLTAKSNEGRFSKRTEIEAESGDHALAQARALDFSGECEVRQTNRLVGKILCFVGRLIAGDGSKRVTDASLQFIVLPQASHIKCPKYLL